MPPTSASLREYQHKRDFAKTTEPRGSRVARDKQATLGFVVQKHDARQLHYDFRLELDGVLKSWAVTKGPSTNPADKRLAVRVEDHPLEYGDFEGTIPKGEYGGGTVMLWDEGTWEPIGDPHKGLRTGDLKFRLDGKRMKGEWVLVHMKGRDSGRRENWLLIKHRDRYATEADALTEKFTTSVETGRDLDGIARGLKPRRKSARKAPRARVWTRSGEVSLPDFRPPQLATLVKDIPAGDDWVYETKYDGYRAIVALAGTEVRLYTRNGNDWTSQFASLVEPLSRITKGSALIDGEVCALKDGTTDFSTLKEALSDEAPLVFFAFDLLEADGENLERLPLLKRKEKLKALLGKRRSSDAIYYSEHVHGHGRKVLDALCAAGEEGVIAKLATAPYRHERTRTWLKVKCLERQEFVIGGWRPSDRKNTFASLILGTWEDGKLAYRGRVGTGYTAEISRDLQARLDQRARKTSPFVNAPRDISRRARWVTPDLVAEIAYTETTPDGSLRHPSFLGLREDKPARDVRLETAVTPPATTRKSRSKVKGMKFTDEMGLAAAERLGIKLTHPDRVVYEDVGITKAQLVAYYDAVAERMLTYMSRRLLSLVRAPDGAAGHHFYQKHAGKGFPKGFVRETITENDGDVKDYLYVEDAAAIIAGVQMSVLEFHVWGSTVDELEKPERIIFDIDPDEDLGFEHVRAAALDIRDALGQWGLQSFPMATGGKGIHVIAPLKPVAEWPLVKDFCQAFAKALESAQPDRFTANIRKVRREGRLFVDYLRNERGSTAVAPFSTRARKGAPVAVPIGWDELETLKAANAFSLAEAAARANADDPWRDYFKLTQSITEGMVNAVAGPVKKA